MNRNKEVDNYIANASDEFRPLITDLREKIFKYFPKGEETFAYRIPVYRYLRKPLFSIAVFKNHYSIVTQDKNIQEKLPNELKGYKVSGTTIHFNQENPITDELLQKIIKIRVTDRENSLK